MASVVGDVSNPNEIGVSGSSAKFEGVRGTSHAAGHGGVVGINDEGTDSAGPGVYGESVKGEGVRGVSHSAFHGGVVGTCDNEAAGVFGESTKGEGVRGVSHSPFHGGVVGTCDNEAAGVFGESTKGEGVRGVGHSAAHGAVVATNDNPAGIALFAKGGRLAGRFEGDVEVTGDVRLVNADCAEDFEIASGDAVEPGTVMVIDARGLLRPSSRPYDRAVAGVISGAGGYRPAIVLDKQAAGGGTRLPVALVGKVCCKVDAQYGPIEVGDLLTTSPTPGYAMKAANRKKAFGSVLGKALTSLPAGRGLVTTLVTLQ